MDLKSYLPDYSKEFVIDALDSDVEIYRDNWGIPHIEANNQHDLFFKESACFIFKLTSTFL